jgi:hypothetical protein
MPNHIHDSSLQVLIVNVVNRAIPFPNAHYLSVLLLLADPNMAVLLNLVLHFLPQSVAAGTVE